MNFRDLTVSAKILSITWIIGTLGSCTSIRYDVQVIDMRKFQLSVDQESGKVEVTETALCEKFQRKPRLNHHEPRFPSNIDAKRISKDDFADLVLTYTEKLKDYVRNEEKYFKEDMANHLSTCGDTLSPVFQK